MKPRITRVTIVNEGEPLFSQYGYTIEIEDEAAGEYIQVTDHHDDCNKITFNPEDWPAIRSAINKMVKLCQ